MAYRNTRARLLAQRDALEPLLARHGVGLRIDRLREADRPIQAALNDPRPLFVEAPSVKSVAHALDRTLDALALCLVSLARPAG
jgi:hypothetical protein